MQDAVQANDFCVRIGEEREAIPPGLAELLRLGGRIHADRDDLDAPVMKLAQVLLKTPQLGVAEWSPIAAVENEHDGAMGLKQLGRSYLFSSDVLKYKGGRRLASTHRTFWRGDLFPKVENARYEEPEQ